MGIKSNEGPFDLRRPTLTQLPLICSAFALPMTRREQRARVSPTLMRRSSATNPMLLGLRPFLVHLDRPCHGQGGS